jgi:hypothetical protein
MGGMGGDGGDGGDARDAGDVGDVGDGRDGEDGGNGGDAGGWGDGDTHSLSERFGGGAGGVDILYGLHLPWGGGWEESV